jgi:hypothetical protein
MSLAPIVQPDQAANFEDFAYSFYAQDPALYAPDVATSDFGQGIWSFDPDSLFADGRVHDTGGSSGTADFLTPVLQTAVPTVPREVAHLALMHNVRADDAEIKVAQDLILGCVAALAPANGTCAMLTTIPIHDEGTCEPQAQVVEPIFAEDLRTVVGFLSATIDFSKLLQENLVSSASDLTLVIEMDERAVTYRIMGGVVAFVGVGDYHSRYGEKYRRVAHLIPILAEEAQSLAHRFDLVFYPDRHFQQRHETNLRWIFCFGSVSIIMLVLLVFMKYDFAMVRENNEQQVVLDTKRQFVRFISHEVRTPLNAVSMASDLLRDQVIHL